MPAFADGLFSTGTNIHSPRLNMARTALLAASAPGIPGVGGVLLDSMLRCPGVDRPHLGALLSETQAGKIRRESLATLEVFTPPDEFAPAFQGGAVATLQRIRARRKLYDPAISRLARELSQWLNRVAPQRLWAILNSMAVIDALAQTTLPPGCELLLQVWDDPRHLAQQRRLDRLARQRVLGRFTRLLRRASRTAVICEEMQSAYQALHPGRYPIIRLSSDATPPQALADPSSASEFRIGLSGSMYCPSAWKTLQQALDHLGWRLDQRQVVLVVAGGRIEFSSREAAECRFYGWRPPEEIQLLMRDCDLLYLPQAFESGERLLSQLSFPTKLSTYIATGRPLLIHTPAYGSLARFAAEHGLGYITHSLSPGELAEQLRQFEAPGFRLNRAEEACRIATSVLTEERYHQAIQEFLAGGEANRPTPP